MVLSIPISFLKKNVIHRVRPLGGYALIKPLLKACYPKQTFVFSIKHINKILS